MLTFTEMELAHLAEGTRTTSNLREFPDTSVRLLFLQRFHLTNPQDHPSLRADLPVP